MIYTGILINGLYFLLFLKSRKIKCHGQDMGNITKIFYQMGLFILQKPFFKNLLDDRLLGRLLILYPTYKKEILTKHYYAQKLSMVLLVIFCGANLVCIKYLSDQRSSILQDSYIIARKGNTEDTSIVRLEVEKENKKTQITYEMAAQKEEKEKVQKEMQQFLEHIDSYILGENASLEQIQKSLQLQQKYADFSFLVDWESDQYGRIDNDGEVSNHDLKQKEVVILTAHLSYDDIEKIYSFPVCVLPAQRTSEELTQEKILMAIQNADKSQSTKSKWALPKRIDGETVSYKLMEDIPYGVYYVFLFVIAILLYFGKDRDVDEKMKKRAKELELKYPEFVSQFVLLAGAGMSVRSIFERMAEEEAMGYYLTQEIKLLVRDVENGVLEGDAIEAFSRRCQNSLYSKLGGLLIQNMKKGNKELLQQLQQEARQAFIKRKNDARRLGEEAGTKLLLPMMGMLIVVMIIIILPAFLSFQL